VQKSNLAKQAKEQNNLTTAADQISQQPDPVIFSMEPAC
jgi:hypothetical protein